MSLCYHTPYILKLHLGENRESAEVHVPVKQIILLISHLFSNLLSCFLFFTQVPDKLGKTVF